MTAFNPDNCFPPIFDKIRNGDIKTTHQLRLILDDLSEEFNITPLKLLEWFKEWLGDRGMELHTTEGMVVIMSR